MIHHRTRTRSFSRSEIGFTVVEMMIVITILAILVSIVIVSMSRVRQSAHRTETANALRQMVGGYNAYMQDHRQRLMPGYLGPSSQAGYVHYVQQLRINAERLDEQPFIDDFSSAGEPYEDLGSYVWRLAPYLDFNWLTMFTDYPSGRTVSRLEADLIDENPAFGPASFSGTEEPSTRALSMVPSIGLNSIFLGGDTAHGGSDVTERHPWHPSVVNGTNERIAATRYTEVRNPAQIVVFAPVGRAATTGDYLNDDYISPDWTDHPVGYPELRPPFLRRAGGVWVASDRQWRVGRKGIDRLDTGEYGNVAGPGAGLPIMRWGTGVLPVAHLDGSAMVEDIGVLSTDMRRWAPDETGTVIPEVELPPGDPGD